MAGSTPIYGFPYPEATDLVADYPALGQELAEDVETVISGLGAGLNLVTPSSIANSGGTASATGGAVSYSGVTSISVNGVFTSTYDNYVMLIVGTASSASTIYQGRMRASGTDSAASSYNFQRFSIAGGTGYNGYSSGTLWNLPTVTTSRAAVTISFFEPQTSNHTVIFSHGYFAGGLDNYDGHHAVNAAYDGFTLIANTGNITGTMRVYGYLD